MGSTEPQAKQCLKPFGHESDGAQGWKERFPFSIFSPSSSEQVPCGLLLLEVPPVFLVHEDQVQKVSGRLHTTRTCKSPLLHVLVRTVQREQVSDPKW